MPIPALNQEERGFESNAQLRLVEPAPAQLRGSLFYPRLLAHLVDAAVLTGFSIYSSKLFSVLLISWHGQAISETGKNASGVFRQAFAYSNAQLFAASFASLAVVYFVGLPLVFGRTPGQSILGLRVSADDGSPVSLRQHVLRLGGLAFTYATGGLLGLVGLRKRDGRFVHDIVSGSRVSKE